MMTNHKQLEELCALAAMGQVSPHELAELTEHIQGCASCQNAYSGFMHILHEELPLIDEQQTSTLRLPSSLFRKNKHKARFLARAKECGFSFSEETEPRHTLWGKIPRLSLPPLSYRFASSLVIVILFVTAGTSVHSWRMSEAGLAAGAAEIARLRSQDTLSRQQMVELSQDRDSVKEQLSQSLSDRDALSLRYKGLEDQLQQALVALQNLTGELAASKSAESQTHNNLRNAEQALSAMSHEVHSLREARSKDASRIVGQELQITELSGRLKEQVVVLERERRLLVADRDIRELMGARNLHIYDLFDVDGEGNYKESSGRVFYTEGKSLVFYAFDLGETGLSTAKHSFQAWGQREGSSGSAVSLGIFYVDNAAHKRWALKFEDPEVLRQIDSVFVTVEPPGGGKRPTGQKLLYAFLGNKANHP